MFKLLKSKSFANGKVYALKTDDGYPIEVTDTFLPYETKFASKDGTNALKGENLGSRAERWMIGVSTMSGCPVGCKFCATGNLKRCRPLTWQEIVDQVQFVLHKEEYDPAISREFKINYTRMGEPFLNIEAVRKAIKVVDSWGFRTHHYVSTIGVKDSDFSWIKGNITLQISLHSLDEARRNWLIPFKNKMSIEELGQIRTKSNLKTTINLTLVAEDDFDINYLKKYFDPEYFFIKLSPINENKTSESNNLGKGIIAAKNLV